MLATSTKHRKFQRQGFALTIDAASPPAFSIPGKGNQSVLDNVLSRKKEKKLDGDTVVGLFNLQRALANVGIYDTLSCSDELRTLLTNRTRTENDTNIASWSFLGIFRDSAIRLERLLFQLSSAENSSKEGLFTAFNFRLHPVYIDVSILCERPAHFMELSSGEGKPFSCAFPRTI